MKEAMEDVFHDSYGEATFAELAAAALDAHDAARALVAMAAKEPGRG